MKKIIASAIGLALVGGVAVTTASAVESQFGGYWRTRMFFQDNFTQDGNIASEDFNDNNSSYNRSDTRTRLYYTAKFNDNLKFVNKFEFNTSWGDTEGGDIGSDGDTFKVKNSYVDATFGMVNAKLGIQGTVISRGFLFDDDFSGAILTGDFGPVKVPVMYISGPQGDVNTTTEDDSHIFAAAPSFMIGDAIKLTPTAVYQTETKTETDTYWVGIDADLKLDAVSAWGTFLYNGGQKDDGTATGNSNDVNAFLFAGGAEVSVLHGQAFYATGDDGTDVDVENFQSLPGQSYYWSEIMGYGIFDNVASQNAPGDKISNIAAFNLGVTFKPMDKLTLGLDAWYAMLDEEILAPNGNMEDELGTEIDAKISYELMENLNADLVFAYLLAGDATGPEDVMEGGVRLSLKF